MGWVDKIPRAGKLFIGGLHALYQKPDLFEKAGISYILSVLDFDIYEAGAFKEYKHLHIKLDDDPNENLLQHFNECVEFVQQGLDSGGGVFVHCAMGKSRSATVCCAYLMQKYDISPEKGLSQVCEGRPVAGPNPGFMVNAPLCPVFRRYLVADPSPFVSGAITNLWTYAQSPRQHRVATHIRYVAQ